MAPIVSAIDYMSIGFPRMGRDRELKKALEAHWSGKIDEAKLMAEAHAVEAAAWETQSKAFSADGGGNYAIGIDGTLYDQVLDWIFFLGLAPQRFDAWESGSISQYFAMARSNVTGCPALSMKKWFGTNYHYLRPEFDGELLAKIKTDGAASVNAAMIVDRVKRACSILGADKAVPMVIGPVTLITLSFCTVNEDDLMDSLIPRYVAVIEAIVKETGVKRIQIHEPCLTLDSAKHQEKLFGKALKCFATSLPDVAIDLVSYYGYIDAETYIWLKELPFQSLALDFCQGMFDYGGTDEDGKITFRGAAAKNVAMLLEHGFPDDKILVCGVIDGRSVQADADARNDAIVAVLTGQACLSERGEKKVILDLGRVAVSSSCTLLHLPYDLEDEPVVPEEEVKGPNQEDIASLRAKWYKIKRGLPQSLRKNLAFATQKLGLIAETAKRVKNITAVCRTTAETIVLEANECKENKRPTVKEMSEILGVDEAVLCRSKPFQERRPLQIGAGSNFLTTSIGSLPQTRKVRVARSKLAKGQISIPDYERLIDEEIIFGIGSQMALGLDVLVHGEFERTDMVEFFAERWGGCFVTLKAWVQSYGSRCIRPPIIADEVKWLGSTTLREYEVAAAQARAACTDPKEAPPVKGMMTGPTTCLNWSFVARPVSRLQIAKEFAGAIASEVNVLEEAGCKVIQVDEPALKEGLPLRVSEQADYLAWATGAFRLATASANSAVQIVTHFCYSDIDGTISEAISDLDADVLTIETSRTSRKATGELMANLSNAGNALSTAKSAALSAQRDLGAGCYDIHSPVVPTVEVMEAKIKEVMEGCDLTKKHKGAYVSTDRIWVNPDCGLKTRTWKQCLGALNNMVQAAKRMRTEYGHRFTA